MQTLSTRYPRFSGAHVVAPRPLGSFLFKPVCNEIQQIFPDEEILNFTRAVTNSVRRGVPGGVGNFQDDVANYILSDLTNTNVTKSRDDCASTSTAWFNTCVELFQAGLSIAFVSVLETVISAKIAAKITKVKCNQRKEVLLSWDSVHSQHPTFEPAIPCSSNGGVDADICPLD
jgi:hypothetical protein